MSQRKDQPLETTKDQPAVLPGPGQAVCLIGYDQNGRCYFTTDALQLIKGQSIAVISVCGPAGQGKTFLLNQVTPILHSQLSAQPRIVLLISFEFSHVTCSFLDRAPDFL